jgi:hypothetical protein
VEGEPPAVAVPLGVGAAGSAAVLALLVPLVAPVPVSVFALGCLKIAETMLPKILMGFSWLRSLLHCHADKLFF